MMESVMRLPPRRSTTSRPGSHDFRERFLGERLEDDDVIETVQELRTEVILQHAQDLLLHFLEAGLSSRSPA
jgi:hypothetical protein